jgi:hypothetical protein
MTELSLRMLENWREAAREASQYEFYPRRVVMGWEFSEDALDRFLEAWNEEESGITRRQMWF